VKYNLLLRIFSPVILLLVALLVAGLVMLLTKLDPLNVYESIFLGAFGSSGNLSETLNLAAVLILTGLSAAIAFKANIWNVGEEGQLFLGAIGSTVFGISSFGAPDFHLLLALVAGFAFGAAWGLIVAGLKIAFHVDEVVSTILLNYIAFLLTGFLLGSVLRNPNAIFNQSLPVLQSAWLPTVDGTSLTIGIILSLVLAVAVYFIIARTVLGWEIRILGSNPMAAEYAGIPWKRTITLTMLISGGLSGLAGGILVLGGTHVLIAGISNSYGYTGIGVAALAGFNALISIPAALFFSALIIGGIGAQSQFGIPFSFIETIIALVILVLTARVFLLRRVLKWSS
jgi:general nucleoside transport system permease protein